MNDQPLQARKAALRTRMLQRRAAAAARLGEFAAEAVAGHVDAMLQTLPRAVISAYWPLEDELDPRPCLFRLAAAGHVLALPRMRDLALPRMRDRGAALGFHRWHPDDALIEGRFKVMEPSAEAPEVDPSVVLVPLLAFDRQGRRLGYGQGFYDRTLARLRARSRATLGVGLGFAAQEVAEVPAGAGDERLDAIVTEEGVRPVAPDLGDRIAAQELRA